MERRRATWLALLVTFLWSTSWVLIKLGLGHSLPPLSFAGLRYMLAFLCLVPFVAFNRAQRAQLLRLERRDWAWLAALGLVYYALTQGAQYLSLAYLPAALVSMLLNLTPVVVGMGGLLFLGERPGAVQWLGLVLTVAGVVVYFQSESLQIDHWFGLGVAVFGVLTNAASSVMGRRVNRSGSLPALLVTFVSMGVGAVLLLLFGGLTQGFGQLTARDWLIIGWLALVNTALAFTLWNYSLRVLSAVESSILNSLMLPQIAIFAYIFLQETLTVLEMIGLALVCLGVILVQVRVSLSHFRRWT
jgi:drug/metabolite transporter (DMT)-like permease